MTKIENIYQRESYQSQVGVGCIELEVDELVDICFGLRMEVLFQRRLHFLKTKKKRKKTQ